MAVVCAGVAELTAAFPSLIIYLNLYCLHVPVITWDLMDSVFGCFHVSWCSVVHYHAAKYSIHFLLFSFSSYTGLELSELLKTSKSRLLVNDSYGKNLLESRSFSSLPREKEGLLFT